MASRSVAGMTYIQCEFGWGSRRVSENRNYSMTVVSQPKVFFSDRKYFLNPGLRGLKFKKRQSNADARSSGVRVSDLVHQMMHETVNASLLSIVRGPRIISVRLAQATVPFLRRNTFHRLRLYCTVLLLAPFTHARKDSILSSFVIHYST